MTPTNPVRARRGFAMPMAIMVMVVLTAGIAAGYAVLGGRKGIAIGNEECGLPGSLLLERVDPWRCLTEEDRARLAGLTQNIDGHLS